MKQGKYRTWPAAKLISDRPRSPRQHRDIEVEGFRSGDQVLQFSEGDWDGLRAMVASTAVTKEEVPEAQSNSGEAIIINGALENTLALQSKLWLTPHGSGQHLYKFDHRHA